MQIIRDFFETLKLSTGNEGLSYFILILVTLLCLLAIPTILSFIFPLIKLSKNGWKNLSFYLYSFSTGFFLVLATFGFLRESLELANQGAWTDNVNVYGYSILVVVVGLAVGILFSFTLKYAITYQINKKLKKSNNRKLNAFVHDHDHGDEHEHDDFDFSHPHSEHFYEVKKYNKNQNIFLRQSKNYNNSKHVHYHPDYIFSNDESIIKAEQEAINSASNKLKVIALLLLLTHRIPEGLLLGYNLNLAANGHENSLTMAYFASLVLHLIPEETIFYFRLREAGYSRIQSLLLSFLGLSLFLPFMLIGCYAGAAIEKNWILKGMMMSAIAGIFIFTTLIEFIPEFYHSHMSKKKWYFILAFLFIGVIFASLILSFHTHNHSH
ncbi:ZIP family metal transporter [Mycoplasma sp. 1232]|uniref:ZIP family metal transporter n=1 Tax=Mycoplasma sp. 1232 TaxID=3108527 RepID=UPI002B25F918|nr:ZIP family metal transporter [Mycoplasma sp. 1232]MEA4333602.1 ZIP family metal transporter [Mycoplasma sp. 1232]